MTTYLPQQGAIRFESASLSPVVNNINGNGFFEFDLGSLVKGESQTVTLDVKLTDLTLVPTGIVKNEATVFASEDDPNEGNNTDLTTTTISSKTKIDFSQGAYIFSEDSPSNLTNIELNRTGDDIDKPVSVVLQLKTSNEAWEDLKDALLDIDLTTYSWLKDVLTDKLKVFERFSKVGKGLAESSLNAFSYAVDVVSYIQSKSTAEEEDFLFSPVPVTFNAGEITKQISISIKDDDEIEGNQLAILSLSSPQPDPNLTLDEDALLGVADDEESVFGIDPANFLEDLAKNMAISAALGAVAGSWAGGIGAVPGLIGGAVMGVGGNYFKYFVGASLQQIWVDYNLSKYEKIHQDVSSRSLSSLSLAPRSMSTESSAYNVANIQPVDINNQGKVIGNQQSNLENIQASLIEANGQTQELGTLGGSMSLPIAINNGQVIGIAENAESELQAFIWQNGVMTALAPEGSETSVPIAINDAGQVIGVYDIVSTSDPNVTENHAFLWDKGTLIELGTLGGGSTLPIDINNLGQIIGISQNGTNEILPFIWQNNQIQELSQVVTLDPSFKIIGASSINDQGQIVSQARDQNGTVNLGVNNINPQQDDQPQTPVDPTTPVDPVAQIDLYEPTNFIPTITQPLTPSNTAANVSSGNSSSESTLGADVLIGDAMDDLILALAGDDLVNGGDGNDWISANQGNDTVDAGNGNDTLHAGKGNDVVFGSDGEDWLNGNVGNDFVGGGNSNDTIYGGQDNDTLFGEEGDDWLNGNQGDDFVDGGEGNDQAYGGQGNDTLTGGNGNDTLFSNIGNDIIEGNNGNDLIYGGQNNDTISGNEGDDTLYGDFGNDLLTANAGNDFLYGGEGDDILFGGEDDDVLIGGLGNDLLIGAEGNDTLTGNQGSDQFYSVVEMVLT